MSNVPFSFFVSLLREISQAGTKSKQPEYPALRIFKSWTRELRTKYTNPPGVTSIVFRLLFPEEDPRRVYNMQEQKLAQQLSELLCLRDNRLLSWNEEHSSGCLGQEIKGILESTFTDADNGISPLSLADVDSLLDELASLSSFSHVSVRNKFPRQHRTRKRILHSLYYTLSPTDACFLTQILLKDLRPVLYPLPTDHYTVALKHYNTASVKMLSLFDAMKAWDPSQIMIKSYRVRAVLEDVAEAFEHGVISVPQIGSPVEIPKSAKGQSCSHALSFLSGSTDCWAEIKYDGERAQIHVEILDDNSSRLTIFSKSKRDSTLDRFGVHDVIKKTLQLGTPMSKIFKNAILDAEMVPFNGECIDEFWRLRRLIESTARGPRAAQQASTDSQESACSMSSQLSDQHRLGLVFFDVLFIDGHALLSIPYSRRRELLESLITPLPGQVILAKRFPIDLREGLMEASSSLAKIYANAIADHHEGLVVKAGDSKYNQWNRKWIKLKKDYIPGYGDTLDLVVVGASWDKGRGRDLRVPPSTLTTFYIGVLQNSHKIKQDPTTVPHFHVYFTVSWGPDRCDLEELNFLFKNSDNMRYSKLDVKHLSYTFTLFSELKRPQLILSVPLLVEIFGAGFTKAQSSKYYELRFPRISKIFRSAERSWRECCSIETLQSIAREAVGRVTSDKDIEDWCDTLWGKGTSSVTSSSKKRKAVVDLWEERLLVLDRKGAAGRRRVTFSEEPSQPLRIMTNVIHASTVNASSQRSSISFPPMPVSVQPHMATSSPPPSSILRESTEANTLQFFNESVVWFPRSSADLPAFRPKWRKLVPQDQIIHVLDSLLTGCGWHEQTGPHQFHALNQWIRRGVIFLDMGSEHGRRWEVHVWGLITERLESMVSLDDGGRKWRKPLFIFDMRTFKFEAEDIEGQAIYRLL